MDKLKAGQTIRFYHKGVDRPTKHNFDEYTVVKVFRNHVLCVEYEKKGQSMLARLAMYF